MSALIAAAKCREFAIDLLHTFRLQRHGRLNRRAWLVRAVLIVWTSSGLDHVPATAEDVKLTGAGFAEEPRGGDRFRYGFALVQRSQRDAGVLVVEYDPDARKHGIHTIVPGGNHGTTLTITPIVEEGEVVGATAEGKADVLYADGSTGHNLPILVGIREDRLDLSVTTRDQALNSNCLVILGGNSIAESPPGRVLMVVGVGEGADEDGNPIMIACGAVVSREDGRQGPRTIEGPACGRFAAVVGENTTVDADLERADVSWKGSSPHVSQGWLGV